VAVVPRRDRDADLFIFLVFVNLFFHLIRVVLALGLMFTIVVRC
jgi:hypothetical protein